MGTKNGHDPNKLTRQQETFVAELLASESFNVAAAATRAGYSHGAQAGFKLMRKPAIQKAIAKAQREREDRCALKADNVLNFLQAALFQDPTQLFEAGENGEWQLKDLKKLPKGMGSLIDHISVTPDGTTSVKLVSKSKALDLAMRHLGLMAPTKIQTEQKAIFDWDKLFDRHNEVNEIELQIEMVDAPDHMTDEEKRAWAEDRIRGREGKVRDYMHRWDDEPDLIEAEIEKMEALDIDRNDLLDQLNSD